MNPRQPGLARRILAWGVHGYTALGLPAAAGIAYLIIDRPIEKSFQWVFVLMLAAMFVDVTDGPMARAIRIRDVVPQFDGRRLDDLVDWLTYTCLPLLFMWKAAVLGSISSWWLLAPLMASAYGFCQVAIKTADGFFLGFPSLWNLVAFYLYNLQPLPDWIALALILLLSFLTFVPLRYLYPNQPGLLNRITNVLAALWGAFLIWIITLMPKDLEYSLTVQRLTQVSLIFPIYYFVSSWILSWRKSRVSGELVSGE
jgi:phosphatidylcholine synthase